MKGLEDEPEGGLRCELCFRLRLAATAERAQSVGYELIATTLTIGRNKQAVTVNRIGQEVCAAYGIRFLDADWKKQDGFRQAVQLSRQLGLYRQHYCGCEFSIPRR